MAPPRPPALPPSAAILVAAVWLGACAAGGVERPSATQARGAAPSPPPPCAAPAPVAAPGAPAAGGSSAAPQGSDRWLWHLPAPPAEPDRAPRPFPPPDAAARALAEDPRALARWLARPPAGEAGEKALLALTELRDPAVRAAARRLEAATAALALPVGPQDLILWGRAGPGEVLAAHGEQGAALRAPERTDAVREPGGAAWGRLAQALLAEAHARFRAERLERYAGMLRARAELARADEHVRALQALLELLRASEDVARAHASAEAGATDAALSARAELEALDSEWRVEQGRRVAAQADLAARLDLDPQTPIGRFVLHDRPFIGMLQAESIDLARERSPRLARLAARLSRLEALGEIAVALAAEGRAWASRWSVELEGRLATARAEFVLAEREMEAEVTRAHVARMAAYERVELLESELLPIARRRLGTARGALAAGRGGLEEVLAAARAVHALELDWADAKREEVAAEARLLVLTGAPYEPKEIGEH